MPFFSFWESPKDPSSTPSTSQPQAQPPSQSQDGSNAEPSSCPVDHKSREAWLNAARQQNTSSTPSNPTFNNAAIPQTPAHAGLFQRGSKIKQQPQGEESLSQDRVVSSIPRGYFDSPPPSSSSAQPSQSQLSQTPPSTQHDHSASSHSNAETHSSFTSPKGTWLYPSEAQFFQALRRKHHNPSPRDMSTVIPIHNAVNERTWSAILKWEKGQGGERCGGPRLVSFSGDSSKTTPKAWVMGVLGYKRPFDRHDWVVERCGTKVEYVIDFYEGKKAPMALSSGGEDGRAGDMGGMMPVSFYIDARPKLNTAEGCRMRVFALFGL